MAQFLSYFYSGEIQNVGEVTYFENLENNEKFNQLNDQFIPRNHDSPSTDYVKINIDSDNDNDNNNDNNDTDGNTKETQTIATEENINIKKEKFQNIQNDENSKYFLNISPQDRKNSLHDYLSNHNFPILAESILSENTNINDSKKLFEAFYRYYSNQTILWGSSLNYYDFVDCSKKIYDIMTDIYSYDDILEELEKYDQFIKFLTKKNYTAIFSKLFSKK